MFDALQRGFRAARQKLTGIAELTEDTIAPALHDVRRSLLEADVELGVVKAFLARVKEQALGQTVQLRAKAGERKVEVSPSHIFIDICHQELVKMMSDPQGAELNIAAKGTPTVVMMVGLQGQGKTTTSAKLAKLFARSGKRVLLVAADLQRPAAVEQLEILGAQITKELKDKTPGYKDTVPVFKPARMDMSPVEVCRQGLNIAKVQKRDLVILDTAGRLAIDERLMQELADIKKETQPHNILLVVNAAAGQNALNTAKAFHERLAITGAVLTMLDGDARGGSALSIREVTGVPIKFAGTGERMDGLEPFRAEGMAQRILDMGDVVGLMNDFKNVVDEETAAKNALRMLKEQFTFDDFLEQIRTIQQMGPLKDILAKMPLGGALPEGVQVDDKQLDRITSMIQSMTKRERADSALFVQQPTRVARVAKGSGHSVEEVADLIQRFDFMKGFMGNIGKSIGAFSKIPGAKQIAMARQLRNMMNVEGGMPGMNELAKQMIESGVAGPGGMPNLPGMPGGIPGFPGGKPGSMPNMDMLQQLMSGGPKGGAPASGDDKDKKKKVRKQERQARKKARRK